MTTTQTAILETEIISLKSENIDLKKALSVSEEKCHNFEIESEHLRHMILNARRAQFGSKSERYVEGSPGQLNLFDTVEEATLPEVVADETEKITYSRRKKKPNEGGTENLPRKEIVISVSDADRFCTCGCQKKLVKYETKERVHFQAAILEIQVEKREVLACPKGCDSSMVTAEAPKQLLPKTKPTTELLAHIAVSKFMDRQPLYHLEKLFLTRHHVNMSRQTMAKWMIGLAVAFQPLINLLKDMLLSHDVAGLDATTLQVLNEPDRKAQTKSNIYCMRGGPPGKGVVLYDYNAKQHKLFLADLLSGYKGYLHVDASGLFEDLILGGLIFLCKCNAHARRKFEEIIKATKSPGLAKEAMRFYREIYKIERAAKEQKLSPEDRYLLRLEKSAPLMAEFKKWLDEKQPRTLPKSAIGKAIQYCLNHWEGLTMFLKDGRLEVDNNLTEQQIKSFVMGRKNWLFSDTVAGADALGVHYSLMLTAKQHKLDPFKYYCAIIKRLPYCTSIADHEALLPWNIQLEQAPA